MPRRVTMRRRETRITRTYIYNVVIKGEPVSESAAADPGDLSVDRRQRPEGRGKPREVFLEMLSYPWKRIHPGIPNVVIAEFGQEPVRIGETRQDHRCFRTGLGHGGHYPFGAAHLDQVIVNDR